MIQIIRTTESRAASIQRRTLLCRYKFHHSAQYPIAFFHQSSDPKPEYPDNTQKSSPTSTTTNDTDIHRDVETFSIKQNSQNINFTDHSIRANMGNVISRLHPARNWGLGFTIACILYALIDHVLILTRLKSKSLKDVQESRLMSLPREVRDMIWQFALDDLPQVKCGPSSQTLSQVLLDQFGTSEKEQLWRLRMTSLPISLLAINHQAFDEVQDALRRQASILIDNFQQPMVTAHYPEYHGTRVHLSGISEAEQSLPLEISLALMPTRIRHLEINLDDLPQLVHSWGDWDPDNQSPGATCIVRGLRQLKTLVVAHHVPAYRVSHILCTHHIESLTKVLWFKTQFRVKVKINLELCEYSEGHMSASSNECQHIKNTYVGTFDHNSPRCDFIAKEELWALSERGKKSLEVRSREMMSSLALGEKPNLISNSLSIFLYHSWISHITRIPRLLHEMSDAAASNYASKGLDGVLDEQHLQQIKDKGWISQELWTKFEYTWNFYYQDRQELRRRFEAEVQRRVTAAEAL